MRDTSVDGVDLTCDAISGMVSASMRAAVVNMSERGQNRSDIMLENIEGDGDVIHRMLMTIRGATDVGRPYVPGKKALWGTFFRL